MWGFALRPAATTPPAPQPQEDGLRALAEVQWPLQPHALLAAPQPQARLAPQPQARLAPQPQARLAPQPHALLAAPQLQAHARLAPQPVTAPQPVWLPQPQPRQQQPSAVGLGFARASQGAGAKEEAVREWGGSAPPEDSERDEGASFAWARHDA
jgi:hypothetical protein